MDDVFADGVGEITVINGVARLTLVTLETAPGARESGDTKPVAVKTRRLVLPLSGLAGLVQQAQALLARIEQASATTGAPAVRPAPANTTPAAGAAPPRSPNF